MSQLPPSLETYEQVLRFVPDFVVVMDREGRVRYMNRVAEGFNLDDVIGAQSTAFIDPAFQELHREVFQRVLDTGEPSEYELSVSPDPSRPEYYRARLSPIVEDGDVRFVVSVATNVTQLRMEREARQEAEEQVEVLRSLVPLCAWCHRIRSDQGYWESVEAFLESQTGATLTHSICPSCAAEMDAEDEAS